MSAILSPSDEDPAAAGPRPGAEWFIVMNRGSGSKEKDEVHRTVTAELDAAGRPHRFVPVESGDIVAACQQAARLAREQGGVMVAAGGDGTINCAAQAALAQECPLGL